jgi:hypothetical protein
MNMMFPGSIHRPHPRKRRMGMHVKHITGGTKTGMVSSGGGTTKGGGTMKPGHMKKRSAFVMPKKDKFGYY